jgi:hypothetical protein
MTVINWLSVSSLNILTFSFMKTPIVKKFNHGMALQWIIFLPVILPLCLVFGAVQGALAMIEKMAQRMWLDMEL